MFFKFTQRLRDTMLPSKVSLGVLSPVVVPRQFPFIMINTRRLLHLFKHLRAGTSTLPCHFVDYLVSRACIIFFPPFFCRSIFLVNKQPNRFSLRIILLYGHSAPSIKIFLLKVDRAKCLPGDFFTSTARAMALGNDEARLGAKDDRRVAENIREETC